MTFLWMNKICVNKIIGEQGTIEDCSNQDTLHGGACGLVKANQGERSLGSEEEGGGGSGSGEGLGREREWQREGLLSPGGARQ